MLFFDTKDEKEIYEALADNDKHNANIERRKHVSRGKNIRNYGAPNKFVNAKNCKQYNKCSDQTTREPR